MSEYTILKDTLAGKKLNTTFIMDCHGHLDMWKAVAGLPCDAESMIDIMDRIGIDMLCINKWNCPDTRTANTDVGAAVKKYPDRFIGFAATQPALGKQATLDELARSFDELGCRGIKVHNGYETLPMRDQWDLLEFRQVVESIWEFAARRKCPLLCHWGVPVEVIQRYPEAQFIIAHSLGVREYAHRYGPYPNAYFDTASSMTLSGNVEYFINTVGVDRILYGSDMPYANPAYRLGQVVGSHVPDEPLRKILGLNLARILNIKPNG